MHWINRFGLLCFAGMVGVANAGKPLVVGVETTPYFPQYQFDGPQGKGYAADLLDAFAKQRGYDVSYKALPVARLYSVYLAGEVDLKYPDNSNWQGDAKKGKTIVYSTAVMSFVDGILVKPANKGKGVDALKTVGLLRGFTPWTFLDLVQSGKIKLAENDTLEGAVKQAQAGRVDGVYANVSVLNYLVTETLKEPGSLVYDEGLPHSEGTYHLSSFKRPEVITDFNDFLAKEKALIDSIKARYKLN